MKRTAVFDDIEAIDESETRTYAEPLAGLRVSWGSILAGALGVVAISLILWALAAAITLTATNASVSSVGRTVVALWICAMATTLVGAFFGGWLAGYLPGNRSAVIGGLHGFFAWALAFLVTSAAGVGVLGSVARTTTEVATTAAAATAQTAGATVGGVAGGQMTLDKNAQNLLESLGYTPSESAMMVQHGKARIQRELRGGGPAMPNARGAIGRAIEWTAGLTWSWFGTWIVSAALAIAGGVMGSMRLRRGIAERPRPVTRPPVTPVPQPA